MTCMVKAAMIEIYNEQINDLLNYKEGKNLPLREDTVQGVYIPNLKEMTITSVEDLIKCINKGFASRAVSSTKMNDQSSRSHCLVQIRLEQKKADGSSDVTKNSKLNLVDLAGSEKVKKTGAKGAALKEAQNINTSLSALGKIIRMLSDKQMKQQEKDKKDGSGGEEKSKADEKKKKSRRKGSGQDKPQHIPYRDSKLTRMLQNSLGGNTKTMLLVACSPHDDNFEETMSTLKFASRARMISNITSVNATSTNMEGFKATGTTVEELTDQLKVGTICVPARLLVHQTYICCVSFVPEDTFFNFFRPRSVSFSFFLFFAQHYKRVLTRLTKKWQRLSKRPRLRTFSLLVSRARPVSSSCEALWKTL